MPLNENIVRKIIHKNVLLSILLFDNFQEKCQEET
jgi:hypothetical protein